MRSSVCQASDPAVLFLHGPGARSGAAGVVVGDADHRARRRFEGSHRPAGQPPPGPAAIAGLIQAGPEQVTQLHRRVPSPGSGHPNPPR